MPSTPSEPGAVPGLSVPHEDWESPPASLRTADTGTEKVRRACLPVIWMPGWAIFERSSSKKGSIPLTTASREPCVFRAIASHHKESFNEKGDRWVERTLPPRETCWLRGLATYPILVEVVTRVFHGQALHVFRGTP